MFDYELPKERIAEWPMAAEGERSDSRLLHALCGNDGTQLVDRHFHDISKLLYKGDLLVLNNTAVSPVRFFVRREGGLQGEIFLLKPSESAGAGCFEAIGRPVAKFKVGDILLTREGVGFEFLGRVPDSTRILVKLSGASFQEACNRSGVMPIPPYIRGGQGTEKDKAFYQTVFAAKEGSIAAPTAALHFSVALLEKLKANGVELCFITLHVGASSIQAIRLNENGEREAPGSEKFSVSIEAVEQIRLAKREKRRLVAVGTTVVRALESLRENLGEVKDAETSLFITPGFEFKLVDALITNFHQPSSTHLSLVEAFIGESAISEIYRHAMEQDYRFLSYGDSMLLERASDYGSVSDV